MPNNVGLIALVATATVALGAPSAPRFNKNYGRIPMVFEENRGQADPRVRFLARGSRYSVYITDCEATLSLRHNDRSANVSVHLTGAHSNLTPQAEELRQSFSNYFVGNDRSRWIQGARHFGQVRVPQLKRGIDLVYKAHHQELEFDLIVAAGTAVSDLRLHFEGAESLSLDSDGDLIIHTAAGDLREHAPISWQDVGGQKRHVTVRHRLQGRHDVIFDVGTYDRTLPLVIDPVVTYSTYFGGSAGDTLAKIAVDSLGYAYVTGTTSSFDFPATSGSIRGGSDAFIAKLNTDGTALVYATVIGGTGQDGANAIAVDGNGNAFITGQTSSSDFPVVFTGGSSYVPHQDVFVTKVDASGVIVQSRYLSASQSSGSAIAVDPAGNAYVAGFTNSAAFPTTPGSLLVTKPGNSTAGFVVKLDVVLNLLYSTYFGGSNSDLPAALAVDSTGHAYIGGTANSANFPITSGVFQTSLRGQSDGFVAELNPLGSGLVYSTLLGGSNYDSVGALALDAAGNVYAAGSTSSIDFPTTSGAFSSVRNSQNSSQTGFVAKLNAGGTAVSFSSYLGGGSNDFIRDIAVNLAGNVFVAGTANSSDFPVTPGALKTQKSRPNYYSDTDLFISEFNPSGSSLIYSTYLGTAANESPSGLAIDSNGGVYIAGNTQSPNYPTTANAFQLTIRPTNNYQAGFITKIDFSSVVLCDIVLSSNATNLPGRGGTGFFTFTVASGCPWEITSDSFITTTGSVSGFGNGAVSYSVGQNPNTYSTVTGTIRVNGGVVTPNANIFTVNQAVGSCTDPVFTPSVLNFDATGGLKDVYVSLPSQCAWNLTSQSPWITVSNSVGSSGPGTLTVYAGPSSYSARQGTIALATKTISISQAGGSCALALTSSHTAVAPQVTSGSVGLTTGSTCGWTAYSTVPWIQVNSKSASGHGNGSVSYVVAGNPGVIPRSGTLLIGDQTFSITQTGGPGANPTSYTPALYTASNSGFSGDGGPVGSAAVSFPTGMAFDSLGNFYFADTANSRLRRVDVNGIITTLAGGDSLFTALHNPTGVAVDGAGNVFLTESGGNRIQKLSTGSIVTIAGTGTAGVSADGQIAATAKVSGPDGIAVDRVGNIYFAESGNHSIRKITPSGILSTVAGIGAPGFGGDGGPANAALLNNPTALSIDTAGNLYFIDSQNHRVRKISTSGIITTVAGGGVGGDEGPATSAQLNFSSGGGLTLDAAGSIYLASNTIRKVTPDGIIHTIFSPSYFGTGVTIDSSGSVYAGAYFNIYKLTPAASFCGFSVTPASTQAVGGGTFNFSITATSASCPWSAISTVPWITVVTPSGMGNGTATVTVAADGTSMSRSGTVAIAGQAIVVSQPLSPANVGIFRNGFFWILDVDGNQAFNSPPDLAFPFGGVSGDIPITGDWNGNGHTKVGIYRPSNGLFILDSNGNGVFDAGDAVYSFFAPQPGDVPVVGDWNGDGRTKIGLFRQGYFWILDFNGNGVFDPAVDKAFPFGGVGGDVPVVGDWTGTGTSKVGVVRFGYFWILDANGNRTFDGTGPGQDYAFPFGGIQGDVPVVGDWDGSGTTKVGVFRMGFFWVLDANGNHLFDGTGPGQDLAFPFGGILGDKPVVGRW